MNLKDRQTEGVFKRLKENKPKAIQWIEKSFMSDNMKDKYTKILESRYMQLNII